AQQLAGLVEEVLSGRDRDAFYIDRTAAAAALAEQLRRFPIRTAAKLKTTGVGCGIAIGLWMDLARAFTMNGRWTDQQRAMAFDLLGIPHAAREDSMAFPEHDEAEMEQALDAQIEALKRLKEETMDARDEEAYHLSQAGVFEEGDGYIQRMQRYEKEAHRRMKAALQELGEEQAR